MKKSTLILSALYLLLLSACSSGMKGVMIYDIDQSLKPVNDIQVLTMQNSVGFEWKKSEDKRVQGVNIYRAIPKNIGNQTFVRIGSSSNRYSTHFVDTHVQPNSQYLYTFTSFSLGKESRHGRVIKVETKPALYGVSFEKAYKLNKGVVKLLWKPHPDKSISSYIVERSVNQGKWEYVTQLEGQLMVEYVDTFVHVGSSYRYRVIAKAYNKILTRPSNVLEVKL